MKTIDENGGEMQGTETIAIAINARYKVWLITILRRLEAKGLLHITWSKGGRGHKTVFRRNRNSPVYPRKVQ